MWKWLLRDKAALLGGLTGVFLLVLLIKALEFFGAEFETTQEYRDRQCSETCQALDGVFVTRTMYGCICERSAERFVVGSE